MLLYRRGSKFPDNLTPRPGIDLDGLSVFDTLNMAVAPGGKAQVIDTEKLKQLAAVLDDAATGHYVIAPVPPDLLALPNWSQSRGTSTIHPLTQELLDAIVDTVRRPK
jgi:hypothetical protein